MTKARPFDQSIADEVCKKLAEGKSLVKICDAAGIPDRSEIYVWLRENEVFRLQYATARTDQADTHFDEIVAIADDDKLTPEDRRVRIEARKWTAGKQRPKKYGDATTIKHADADGEKLTLRSIIGELDGGTAGLPGAETKAGGSKLAAE